VGQIRPSGALQRLPDTTVSRYALRLPECTDLTPSNGSIITSFGINQMKLEILLLKSRIIVSASRIDGSIC